MLVLGDTRNGLKFILWFLFDTKKNLVGKSFFFQTFQDCSKVMSAEILFLKYSVLVH